jgi:type I site-specific restriction-modification system R (restriction) subunit
MKRYSLSSNYRGQGFAKIVTARTNKEAAEKLGVSIYQVNYFAFKTRADYEIDGINAVFDSRFIIEKESHLIHQEISLDRFKALVDSQIDDTYKKWEIQMGIKRDVNER